MPSELFGGGFWWLSAAMADDARLSRLSIFHSSTSNDESASESSEESATPGSSPTESSSTEGRSVSPEVIEEVQSFDFNPQPQLQYMPINILELIIHHLPSRDITISCDKNLYAQSPYDTGLYALPHAVPALLQVNDRLRKCAQEIYRLSFSGYLAHGPIYINFASDTLIIANEETFSTFLFRLAYKIPDIDMTPSERIDEEDRHHIDFELQHLSFRSYLGLQSMSTLVRFHKLRKVTFVERPAPRRARTRHASVRSEDDSLKAQTKALWEERARRRGQVGFEVPEMVSVSLREFDLLFSITGQPDLAAPSDGTKVV